MSKKNHSPRPVPPDNQSHAGAEFQPQDDQNKMAEQGAGFQGQDPKRRLGDFNGAGEHSHLQPGPLNDGGQRHGEDAG